MMALLDCDLYICDRFSLKTFTLLIVAVVLVFSIELNLKQLYVILKAF